MGFMPTFALINIYREINKIAKPLIKEEETNKYRCKNCSKLFKAPEFVHKHLTTKHPELFEHLNQVRTSVCPSQSLSLTLICRTCHCSITSSWIPNTSFR